MIRLQRMAAVAWLLSANCLAVAAPPDLTGIWTMGTDGRAGASLNGPGDFEKTAPFTPLARQKLAEYHALVDATGDTPGAHCVPHGMPLAVFLGGGYPVEFVQRPEQLTIIYETHNEVRRVFLDGRRIDPKEILPSRGGVSYGSWQGNTLVVETVGMKESVDQPTAHGENARVIERYTPYTEGGMKRMKVELTIEDPEFYTSPPTLTRTYTQLKEGRMLDYACPEPDWEDHLDMLRQQKNKK
ncbi:MAG: hypothetical protein IT482_02490 [Gammaproteobacteria bacterium]|jgi:hypothetical protein|nr:hypothetical protein [Gammaproteobacteria bacterium]